MENLLPLGPEPVPELPRPREWICERCTDPLNVWDWGNHPIDATDPPSVHCSACLIDLAPHEQRPLANVTQFRHHHTWCCTQYAACHPALFVR